jgi:hypothetical protein
MAQFDEKCTQECVQDFIAQLKHQTVTEVLADSELPRKS